MTFGLILTITALLATCAAADDAPPTPVFAYNYHVKGVLSLPYAELNEPFSAWYDEPKSRSRTDYYGDLYQVYQFGPKYAPEAGVRDYGALYKLLYVPTNYKPTQQNQQSSANSAGGSKSVNEMSQTKRACFTIAGGVGATVGPQTVLPNLESFSFAGHERCPHASATHRHMQCELWKLVNEVGDKRNVYKMWVYRNESSHVLVPVHYWMLGYDSLLGSHYDRYDVTYYDYRVGGAQDEAFAFEPKALQCAPMDGPGDDASDAQLRAHLITQNPMHEFVEEPQRYDHVDAKFDEFAREHDKSYTGAEHKRRGWRNYMHNFRFINAKNRELKEYKLKVNRYADENVRELRYLRGRQSLRAANTQNNGGLDYAAHHPEVLQSGGNSARAAPLPESFDWSIRGAVTPVKDQAVCGSCWSFGTSGTLEGAYFVKTGKLPRLSQQQMVDCSWKYGNNGCDGGLDFQAYKYIMDAGGAALEEDYGSYLGVDGKCHDSAVKKAVKIKGFYNVTANSVDALRHALINYGPTTVAIDASQPTFTFYSHGVYYDPKCNKSPDHLDHQVLVVGYTKIDGKFVWQVKNSWSTNWGDNGYIMMSAENNNCGLMDQPTVPIIDA